MRCRTISIATIVSVVGFLAAGAITRYQTAGESRRPAVEGKFDEKRFGLTQSSVVRRRSEYRLQSAMLGIPTQPTEVGTLNAVAPTVVIELNVASVSCSDLALGSRRICLSRQPEVSEACEQNQHRRAREKEVPDSHALRQRSRD